MQQPASITGQKQSSGAASQREVKKVTQPVEAPGVVTATKPVEAPGAVLATWPVEAPGATSEMQPTGQDSSLPFDVDRPEAQSPGPASQIFSSGRPEVQPPGPTVQPATVVKKLTTSLTGSGVPVAELAADAEQFSDRASSYADEGEVSDLESSGLDQEELLDVDQELTAEQTYKETMHGVRSLIAWNDIPVFDSASSSQDDNPFTGSRTSHTGKVSVNVPVDEWLFRKYEKLNITVQEGYNGMGCIVKRRFYCVNTSYQMDNC